MIQFINSIEPGQWTILAVIAVGFATAYFKFKPDQTRANTEAVKASNENVVAQFKAFRDEVHGYKNEVMKLQGKIYDLERELSGALRNSERRGEKMNTLRFILNMLIDEFTAKDPKNMVLARAKTMLLRIEDEPHQIDGSDTLHRAEDAHKATGEVINEIKKDEAGK